MTFCSAALHPRLLRAAKFFNQNQKEGGGLGNITTRIGARIGIWNHTVGGRVTRDALKISVYLLSFFLNYTVCKAVIVTALFKARTIADKSQRRVHIVSWMFQKRRAWSHVGSTDPSVDQMLSVENSHGCADVCVWLSKLLNSERRSLIILYFIVSYVILSATGDAGILENYRRRNNWKGNVSRNRIVSSGNIRRTFSFHSPYFHIRHECTCTRFNATVQTSPICRNSDDLIHAWYLTKVKTRALCLKFSCDHCRIKAPRESTQLICCSIENARNAGFNTITKQFTGF